MLAAFEAWGRLGLEEYIYDYCKERAHAEGGISWRLIVDDYESLQHRVWILLAMLPDAIILSLIKNTIAWDMKSEPVKSLVNRYMLPKLSEPCAGVYVNVIRYDYDIPETLAIVPTGDPTSNGRWLSAQKIKRLVTLIEGYRDDMDKDKGVNHRIDSVFGKARPGERQFTFETPQRLKNLNDWLDVISEQYLSNVDPLNKELSFKRCPMEVGWAQNIPERLKAHVSNQNTTRIFGVVNAITRISPFNFPTPLQLVLWPIWKDEKAGNEWHKIAEILGSILCSSYIRWGGYNHTLAGGSNTTWLLDNAEEWSNSSSMAVRRFTEVNDLQLDFRKLEDKAEDIDLVAQHAHLRTAVHDMDTDVLRRQKRATELSKLIEDALAAKKELERQLHREQATAMTMSTQPEIVRQALDAQRHLKRSKIIRELRPKYLRFLDLAEDDPGYQSLLNELNENDSDILDVLIKESEP